MAAASRDAGAGQSRRVHRGLLAQHHGPIERAHSAVEWVDGLQDRAELRAIMLAHPHLHVLCGHDHRAADHVLRPGEAPRVFTPRAVVEHDRPLRLYRVLGTKLTPLASAMPRRAAAKLLVHALADAGFEH